MTPNQSMVAAILTAILTSSMWPYFGPKIIEWKNHKKRTEATRTREAGERREQERDEWMRDAERAYKRVQGECDACHKEIERIRREEIEPLKRDNATMKEALLNRIETLEEILPYIADLPEEKIRDIRAANRAHRQAVFRTTIL